MNLHKQSLWIHAVSVGEVLSLQHLIGEIKKKHPGWMIHFSCLTNSGYHMAQENLKDADHMFFIPLDFKILVRKFFLRLKPDVFILAESEFWPHLLKEAGQRTKGVLLVNGRISYQSFKRYKKINRLVKRVLSSINLFLVQTERDKNFLEKLEVESRRIRIAGNLKSEIELPLLSPDELLRMKEDLNIGQKAKIIVAGSVHKGEEEPLMEAYVQARRTKAHLKFILVPRHPERSSEVERTCLKYPFTVVKKTQFTSGTEWDILVLDTLGELTRYYALSDVSFVGGSLVPIGGHNFLEPAFYKKPVFFGPHMDNFAHLAKVFVESDAVRMIHDQEDLVNMFLIPYEKSYEDLGKKAKATLQSLQGATEKTIAAIESMMFR